jgi:4-hydroxy-2-oxoheptanedioate aldolase
MMSTPGRPAFDHGDVNAGGNDLDPRKERAPLAAQLAVLAADRVVHGVTILSGSAMLAELAIRCGFDTVWVEMEHGASDYNTLAAICQAAERAGGTATARVPDGQRCHILRALEVGAGIVVVPLINTEAAAREIVRFAKFPPLGARGYNGRSRALGYGLQPIAEAMARANREVKIIAQIETREALAHLDAICAVDGLDGILVGPGDLSSDFGIPGQFEDAGLIGHVAGAIRGARAAGKLGGILVGPGPMLDAALGAGANLVFAGGDVANLVPAWQSLHRAMAG